MKKDKFGYYVFALGVAGVFLRRLLYAVAVDDRGLLVRTHPLEIVLWMLILAAVALTLTAKPIVRTPKHWVKSLGCLYAAVGMLFAAQDLTNGFPALLKLLKLAAPLTALLLAVTGIRMWKGKSPVPGTWAVVCCVLVLRLVAAYQTWSREPQMMDYLFSLLGSLCLTGYAYHLAAKEAGAAEKSCWLFRLGLLAGFFCLTAGTGRVPLPFYTVMACGVMLDVLSGEEAPC